MQPADIDPDVEDMVLALNRAHEVALSWLDAPRLRWLLGQAFYARRIGRLDAFLLAFDERAPEYDSPNYLWFRARYPRFVYVDRVVVDDRARGRGLGTILYADLTRQALAAGHGLLACEVNADPPNPVSDAFHAAQGFAGVGTAAIHGGAKTVRYLARRIDG